MPPATAAEKAEAVEAPPAPPPRKGLFSAGGYMVLLVILVVEGFLVFTAARYFGQGGGPTAAIDTKVVVVDLGPWPLLYDEPEDFVVMAEPDLDETVYASDFAATNGTMLVSGYTLEWDPVTGSVPGYLVVDDLLDGDDAPVPVSADGAFAAVFSGDTLLVNSLALEDVVLGAGVYAIDLAGFGDPYLALAFPEDAAASGFLAVTDEGFAVAGYADSTYENHLRVVAAVPSAGESPLDLGDAVEIADSHVLGASALGSGAVFIDGYYDETWSRVVDGVVWVPLSLEGLSPEDSDIEVGEAVRLLDVPDDACGTVAFLGDSLSASALAGLLSPSLLVALDVAPAGGDTERALVELGLSD
jgi:hypothetical protein